MANPSAQADAWITRVSDGPRRPRRAGRSIHAFCYIQPVIAEKFSRRSPGHAYFITMKLNNLWRNARWASIVNATQPPLNVNIEIMYLYTRDCAISIGRTRRSSQNDISAREA